MTRYRDLREFIKALEARGKLYRFTDPINKDTELFPVFRVQQRGFADADRKVFLFENVVGARGERYDMPVLAGVYGGSDAIAALGLGCETYQEALERWHEGIAHPIEPVVVASGRVQDVVLTGDDLRTRGLDILPVPVEEPGFSGMLRTGLPMITNHPETGVRNVGTYNGFLRARDRMLAAIGGGSHAMDVHWQAARERKEGLPLAIVIGCTPDLMAAGSARVPYGMDEVAVAGGITGAPLELVRCRTIPLEVPAHAEVVIEGIMSTEFVEPRAPFGEFPGYIHSDMNMRPVLDVTAITHRKDAMFTAVLVGMPPSDNSVIACLVRSATTYDYLKYERSYPVEEVYFPQLAGGGNEFCAIRLAASAPPEAGQRIADDLATKRGRDDVRVAKVTIIVDSDIDVRDPDLLLWALTFRTTGGRDFGFVATGGGGLDPAAAPTGSSTGRMGAEGGQGYGRIIINAARKWPYPPVAMPKREYMEHALEIWGRQKDLPAPHLRHPWYGYTLGYWPDEHQRYADLMTRGEYLKVGDELAEMRERVRDDMMRPSGTPSPPQLSGRNPGPPG